MMTHHQQSIIMKTSKQLYINQAIIDGTKFVPTLLYFDYTTSDELNNFYSCVCFVSVGIVQNWLR